MSKQRSKGSGGADATVILEALRTVTSVCAPKRGGDASRRDYNWWVAGSYLPLWLSDSPSDSSCCFPELGVASTFRVQAVAEGAGRNLVASKGDKSNGDSTAFTFYRIIKSWVLRRCWPPPEEFERLSARFSSWTLRHGGISPLTNSAASPNHCRLDRLPRNFTRLKNNLQDPNKL